jgi:hypothetical protein
VGLDAKGCRSAASAAIPDRLPQHTQDRHWKVQRSAPSPLTFDVTKQGSWAGLLILENYIDLLYYSQKSYTMLTSYDRRSFHLFFYLYRLPFHEPTMK